MQSLVSYHWVRWEVGQPPTFCMFFSPWQNKQEAHVVNRYTRPIVVANDKTSSREELELTHKWLFSTYNGDKYFHRQLTCPSPTNRWHEHSKWCFPCLKIRNWHNLMHSLFVYFFIFELVQILCDRASK